MNRVIKRAAAIRDLDKHAAYLGQRSPRTAIRFLEAAEQACGQLAGMPEMGGLWETDNLQLAGLRVWPIRGFENHLLFYRPALSVIFYY